MQPPTWGFIPRRSPRVPPALSPLGFAELGVGSRSNACCRDPRRKIPPHSRSGPSALSVSLYLAQLRSGFAGDLIALGFELAAHARVGVRRFRRVSEASNDVGWRALLHQQA